MVLDKTLENPLDHKEIQPVHPKGDQSWVFIGRTDAEAQTPILWTHDVMDWFIWNDPDAGKDWRQVKEKSEDKMVGWYHQLNGHEFEWAPGVGDGQVSLVSCSPWGHKESDTTERLNWNIFVRFHSVTDLSLPTEAEIGSASARASSFSLASEPFWLNPACRWSHYFSWFVQMFWSHLVYPWPWMRTSHFSKKLWPLERRKGTSEPKSGCSEGHRPQSVVLRVFTWLKSLYETWVFTLRCLWPFSYFCACLMVVCLHPRGKWLISLNTFSQSQISVFSQYSVQFSRSVVSDSL